MSTSLENGEDGYHGAPFALSGKVVVVACNVMLPLCGGEVAPPSPPPPPQLANVRLASISPRVLPKNFMSCLQSCEFDGTVQRAESIRGNRYTHCFILDCR